MSFDDVITDVIPGRRNAPDPESRRPRRPELDSGFALARAPE
jgi:hypothetical protein